jgi:hypothetical protein
MRPILKMLVVLALALPAATAVAQTQSGGIRGTVTDETGTPLELVTVVASGPALQQPQTEFTDSAGQYYISSLPPGMYSMIFIYGEAKVRRENVEVAVGQTITVPAKVNTTVTDTIVIKERAPAIDGGSTKIGVRVGQDVLKNIPQNGRTFAGTLSSAAGSQGDALGESFSGSTSVENSYVVDGINTTGITAGGIGLPVINNFIQEVEIITGGYNAEFGRSTGGVVNVVTKTGSNEFHGSVWANIQPLEADQQSVASASSAISRKDRLDMNFDVGFEVGGPIVKDRLWFYVGFAPVLNRDTITRITGTRVDRNVRGFDYNDASCDKNNDGTCDGDGDPATTPAALCEITRTCESDNRADINDSTGFALVEEIGRRTYKNKVNQYQFTGKINFAVSPDHQGQVGLTGTPTTATLINGVAGTETAMQSKFRQLTTDASAKWTSKLLNNKLQIDAVFGWHRDKQADESVHEFLPNDPSRRSSETSTVQILSSDPTIANLATLGQNRDMNEDQETIRHCTDDDGMFDAFPGIVNCPVNIYSMNSIGTINDALENRYTGKLTVTQRLQALGHHQFKGGLDFEDNRLDDTQDFTGGAFIQSFDDWESTRYVRVNPQGTDVCGYEEDGSARLCDYLDDLPVHGRTFNWSAFLQDSWSIMPNLTINAGLRYEQQLLGYAKEIQGTLDPVTGQTVGSTAMHLTDLIAPRLGVIYDWTKEGRSKLYGSWGRFYESIPMDINLRAFGGESTYSAYWDWESQCGDPSDDPKDTAWPSQPQNCPVSPSMDGSVAPDFGDYLFGGNDDSLGIPSGVTLIAPGIKGQYMDELVLGVEYEVLEDLRVGLSYQNRRLGRVIEDLSPDGGQTYFLANPGEFSKDEEQKLIDQIEGMDEEDPIREQLVNRLNLFQRVRNFDKPRRDYHAVQVTAAKRFSRAFMLQGSYTWSRLRGNFPGLFSPDSGQLDPNISSQYDLSELLSNRDGALPHDRPHSVKLDGYYTFDLKQAGRITAGARLRAQSGVPKNVLARHAGYGRLESFLLPRGEAGRTDMTANADLHVAYARQLGSRMELELFAEVFNVLNSQQQTAVDNEYTTDVIDPIVGGGLEDLPYAKNANGAMGRIVTRKQNFGNTTARTAPLSARFGATLSF